MQGADHKCVLCVCPLIVSAKPCRVPAAQPSNPLDWMHTGQGDLRWSLFAASLPCMVCLKAFKKTDYRGNACTQNQQKGWRQSPLL